MHAIFSFLLPAPLKRTSARNTRSSFLYLVLSILFFPAHAQLHSPINNPVLPGVADAGVMRYNGEYFIGGVFTRGNLFRSQDLVQWKGPVHVFSMQNEWATAFGVGDEQIHANDMVYLNGNFHLYWSVNYWGANKNIVHIGHATARHVLGPYIEPDKKNWLENRIDPKLFIDDDGKLYLYYVKFTDGNTIWARPMNDPATFDGPAVYLFSSLPNTWETADNRVEEGPWVIKYRNRYYLMYNANHTSPAYGNYALGVAEANHPLGFHHGSKYPYPLVASNQPAVESAYPNLLRYNQAARDSFFFITSLPSSNWASMEFSTNNWLKGRPGFGSEVTRNSTTRITRTNWQSDDIWLRKTFTAQKSEIGNLVLRINHDGDTEVYLNGVMVYSGKGRRYHSILADSIKLLLKEGENIIAIHSKRGRRSGFLDLALFDYGAAQPDDILFSPGQPNILKGPNGFEWWMIYMANKNAEQRGQYINRIHFFNKTMHADPITSVKTAGYFPPPAKPSFQDVFNDTLDSGRKQWKKQGGFWQVRDEAFLQQDNIEAHAQIPASASSYFLFEANFKLDSAARQAGVTFSFSEKKYVKVFVDATRNSLSWQEVDGRMIKTVKLALPDSFDLHVYHKISVYKNGTAFQIYLDDLPVPMNLPEKKDWSGRALPGLYANGSVTFDGILYTMGWDEFDSTITGWNNITIPTHQAGKWRTGSKGLQQLEKAKGVHAAFKGDLLDQYEITVQVENDSLSGSAGIYPVYVDEKNYLRASIDYTSQQLVITGMMNGSALRRQEVPLEAERLLYANMTETDFIEKHFTLPYTSTLSEIILNKTPHGNPDMLIENMQEKVDIFYRQGNSWFPLKDYRIMPSAHAGYIRLGFPPLNADGLKFVNRQPEDRNFYVYTCSVKEKIKKGYNLRAVKLAKEIIFLVDGKELLRIPHEFGPSRLGLVTENTAANFNGITVFHLPS